MNLLKWELKKILNPILLLVIILIGFIFYYLFSSFYIEYFNNGSAQEARFQLATDWIKDYGTTIEPSERLELNSKLDDLKKEFDRQIINISGTSKLGIIDYESFIDWIENNDNSELSEKQLQENDKLISEVKNNTNFNIIHEFIIFLDEYDELAHGGSALDKGAGIFSSETLENLSIRRIREIESSSEIYGFLPNSVINSTNKFFNYLSIWCVFSTVLLISPTFVRDRLYGVRFMQCVSRKGRKVNIYQIIAAFLSSLLLLLLNFALYAIPFLKTGALVFWDCPIVSVWVEDYPWFNWTYGQYLIALTLLIILITISVIGFVIVLSQYSGNYVSMLFKDIPLLIVFIWVIIPCIIAGAGRFSNVVTEILCFQGAEWLCSILLAFLALVLCGLAYYSKQKKDILL